MREGEAGFDETSGSGIEAQDGALGLDDLISEYEPEENESGTETARKALELIKQSKDFRETGGDEGDESEETETEGQEAQGNPADNVIAEGKQRARDENGKFIKQDAKAKAATEQTQEQSASAPDLEPPAIIRPEAKKAFMNMPEGLRKEANRIFRDIQAYGTQQNQRLAASLKESEGIITSARHYIQTNNLIDASGRAYTPDRLFGELLKTHNEIVQDPDRRIADMIRDTNGNIENIQAYLNGEDPNGVNLTKHPQFTALLNELKTVKGELGTLRGERVAASIAPASAEAEAVMREIDPATGNYRYPELHDEVFLESTKPLVAAFRRTDSNLSLGAALKKAHAVLTGQNLSSTNGNPTRAPARSNQQQQRARSAAVSVRGRVTPIGVGDKDLDDLDIADIPNSATETTRMVMRKLQGG